jgi:hypothetical protein
MKYDTIEELIAAQRWSAGKNMSAFDSASNYCGEDFSAWVVGPGRNRDSDCVQETNFAVALERLGGEKEDVVRVVRIGHWACGWVEQIHVAATATKELGVLLEIHNDLDSYPVLDDDALSEAETKEADKTWANCFSDEERIDYIRANREQFEFHSFADLLSCCRGTYFAGYASELIYG